MDGLPWKEYTIAAETTDGRYDQTAVKVLAARDQYPIGQSLRNWVVAPAAGKPVGASARSEKPIKGNCYNYAPRTHSGRCRSIR